MNSHEQSWIVVDSGQQWARANIIQCDDAKIRERWDSHAADNCDTFDSVNRIQYIVKSHCENCIGPNVANTWHGHNCWNTSPVSRLSAIFICMCTHTHTVELCHDNWHRSMCVPMVWQLISAALDGGYLRAAYDGQIACIMFLLVATILLVHYCGQGPRPTTGCHCWPSLLCRDLRRSLRVSPTFSHQPSLEALKRLWRVTVNCCTVQRHTT